MKLLVIGSGGREHAIVWALSKSDVQPQLFCTPGNAGVSELAQCRPINVTEREALRDFALSESIDLTIVGPEGPLAEGLVDEFQANGLKIFGPTRSAARLESSKAFAKDFMARHGIPTAAYSIAASKSEAVDVLRSGEFGAADASVVVKADGLAAGKGVVVAQSRTEAERAVSDLAGASESPILIEEALAGQEASILVFTDGDDYAVMPPARDYKRIGEGDTGPNTGGMGSVTHARIVSKHDYDRIVREIVEPTLGAAREEGFPFRGVLFVGLMLTAEGPKVLEYNARFGDPETQAILVRLQSDLLSIFQAVCDGNLGGITVEWSGGSSACVVLANRGYPGKYDSGAVIHGLQEKSSAVHLFHAGTARSDEGQIQATGGRVLGVAAGEGTLEHCLERCYDAITLIHWDGMQYRRDIGR